MLAGFFLPWVHGPGLLDDRSFSGFRLVSFTGQLEDAGLAPLPELAWLGVRALLVFVAIAAAWQTLLAPRFRWHAAYRLSGWFLVVSGVGAVTFCASQWGLGAPLAGLVLVLTGCALFALCELLDPGGGPGPEAASALTGRRHHPG